MKTILKFSLLFSLLFSSLVKAQINYSGTLSHVTHFGKFDCGYKFVFIDYAALTIDIYNVNQSLYKTIAIPPHPSATSMGVQFLTDKLFDLDTSFEYVLFTNSGTLTSQKVEIYNESGALLFSRDSASISDNGLAPYALNSYQYIYFNGIKTEMRLIIYRVPNVYERYDLPGHLPCSECSQGIVSGFAEDSKVPDKSATFYPNPASQYLKLKYVLPLGAKKAFIKVYDMQGKLVQDMEVTNSFDNILLPSDYNNGLYLYSLIVDGVVIKNEKLVLLK